MSAEITGKDLLRVLGGSLLGLAFVAYLLYAEAIGEWLRSVLR